MSNLTIRHAGQPGDTYPVYQVGSAELSLDSGGCTLYVDNHEMITFTTQPTEPGDVSPAGSLELVRQLAQLLSEPEVRDALAQARPQPQQVGQLADGTPVTSFYSDEKPYHLMSYDVAEWAGGVSAWVAQAPNGTHIHLALTPSQYITMTPPQYAALREAFLADIGGQLLKLWLAR